MLAAEVSLWRAPLDVSDAQLGVLGAALSAAERARADALPEARSRARFIADHGWRRTLLAERSGRRAAEIDYVVGAYGKPEVPGTDWRFSASRSGATALYALSSAVEIGVDIEETRTAAETPVRRVFTPRERSALEGLAPDERRRAALTCWVRKEAYLKTLGTGLLFPVDGIEVWAGDDRDVRHDEVVVRHVDLGPHLVAALGVRVGAGAAPAIRVSLGELGDGT